MKPRSLVALALLVLGLGAFVWFGREVPSTDERAALAKRVLTIDAEEVRRLDIERDGVTLSFVRDLPPAGDGPGAGSVPGDWEIVSPFSAAADSSRVDGLVGRLIEIEMERTLEGVERAEVGLAEPRARVTIETVDDRFGLEIGAEVPASSTMTLARQGVDSVYVVPSTIWSDLVTQGVEWRDKRLFRSARDEVTAMRIERGPSVVRLVRRGDDFWLESPAVDRADSALANGLLTTLTGLTAERFVSPSELEGLATGLDSAVATLTVESSGGEASEWVLNLGEPESEVEGSPRFARLGDEVVTIGADLVTAVERAAADWRSKDLISGDVYGLERVEIEDEIGSLELRRDDADWLRDGGGDRLRRRHRLPVCVVRLACRRGRRTRGGDLARSTGAHREVDLAGRRRIGRGGPGRDPDAPTTAATA